MPKKQFINLEAIYNVQCSLPEMLADDLLDFINDFQEAH